MTGNYGADLEGKLDEFYCEYCHRTSDTSQ